MNFSDAQIKSILKSTEAAMTAHKINKHVIHGLKTTLRSYLMRTGVVENVCAYCLGSGKKGE